jgi:hypothetical protein
MSKKYDSRRKLLIRKITEIKYIFSYYPILKLCVTNKTVNEDSQTEDF